MAFKTAKAKRSFTYSAVILLGISIFILTYWYHFIPNNRKTIHKNGFLLLQTIAGNIEDMANARRSLFNTFYENALDSFRNPRTGEARESRIKALLKDNKIDATVRISTVNAIDGDSAYIRIDDGKLRVCFFKDRVKEKVEFTENIDPLLRSILSTQRSELFQSYLLGKMNGKTTELLYSDKELAVRSDKGIDSLLPKGVESFLTGIRELRLHDVSQRVFYYPFRLQHTQLVIGGFVNAKEYNSALRNVPFYFIYPLVIIFLLLLVTLPIIKFYVMDPNEQVRRKDIIFFGLSVFTGASFLTLMIIHFCLWKGEEERVRQHLASLSEQIKKSFITEIRRSYEQLNMLDKYKNDHSQLTAKHFNYSDSIRKFVHDSTMVPSRYFYFDRISWIDSSGEQKIKADLYSQAVFTNISTRKYFDVFKKGAPYSLPGDREKTIGLEPIYSRTNADFKIIISRQDTMPGGYIVAMAIHPGSVVNTILPAGYGFCIIDEQGNVQMHADKNRNLNENFFQKIEPSGDVRSAVMTRQVKEVNDVVAYGKTHQMQVAPLDGLPFHLITFYDKGFIVPVNMRILLFALAFCILSFVTCMLLWGAMPTKYKTQHPLVYCRIDAISWIIPRAAESTYYFHAFCFVTAYVIVLLGYVLLNRHYNVSNFTILALLVVTPFNIIFSLYTIRAAFQPVNNVHRAERIKERLKLSMIIGIHLAISLIVYNYPTNPSSITTGFLTCQLAINLVLWVYALSKNTSAIFSLGSKIPFLTGYNLLATSLVLALSVLPSAMFTWYAHNQELIQSVKRQQLHLAHAIRDRSYVIQEMKGVKDTSLPIPGFYLDSLQLSSGIYTINKDNALYKPVNGGGGKAAKPFDDFYFLVADIVSNPYYKQQSYAVLTDTANDNSWHWERKDSLIHFSYYPSLPNLKKSGNASVNNMLAISSSMPSRFIVLGSLKALIPLLLLIALLIRGLYVWIRLNSRRIFLTRYIVGHTKVDMKRNLIEAYYNDKTANSRETHPPRIYSHYTYNNIHCLDWKKVHQYEEAIAEDIHNGKDLYSFIWNECSEKEKSLLYNVAYDGLINYKNMLEIIELMKKGILIEDGERIRTFSPGFRAYILSICTEDNEDMARIQKKHLENSTWQSIRMPLLILLIGIAVLVFFTQQYIFDKLLILAGGLSTLTTIIMKFLGGSAKEQVSANKG